MKSWPTFSDLLISVAKGWRRRKNDECLLSLALPIPNVDPLLKFRHLAGDHTYRFLWDKTPALCIAAAGRCQHFDLSGPRRFDLAQRFADATMSRLLDLTPQAPLQAKPRIFFAFSFFEQPSERKNFSSLPPGVQAVIPRWQLSRESDSSWLRLNALASDEAEARELVEKIWLMRDCLFEETHSVEDLGKFYNFSYSGSSHWENAYKPSLERGIDLVNKGVLEKLVLAVRHSIFLEEPLDPLDLLFRLRNEAGGSCRFLWQRSNQEVFFGASPERLLDLYGNQLSIDALAGTASRGDKGDGLLRSDKDLREHGIVVSSINKKLLQLGLTPQRSIHPKLARYGELVHLHTPINATVNDCSPLQLVELLHPTPAVAGVPRPEALSWLKTLEPFQRGGYAAPIGWIDSTGNAEFRVAIRCGIALGKELQLIAGAGLVKGSSVDRELQEVCLKLEVLATQLHPAFSLERRRSIT